MGKSKEKSHSVKLLFWPYPYLKYLMDLYTPLSVKFLLWWCDVVCEKHVIQALMHRRYTNTTVTTHARTQRTYVTPQWPRTHTHTQHTHTTHTHTYTYIHTCYNPLFILWSNGVIYCSSVYIIGGIIWIVLSLVVRVVHAAAFDMFSQHVHMEWKSGPQWVYTTTYVLRILKKQLVIFWPHTVHFLWATHW